jgi:hypothetical protein
VFCSRVLKNGERGCGDLTVIDETADYEFGFELRCLTKNISMAS